MKRTKITLLLLILVLGGLGWWLHTGVPVSTQQHEEEAHVQTAVESAVNAITSADINAVRERVENARLALRLTAAQRESAEAELLQAERSVEELERFIEDIEARGEDPADYAEEGLAKFQPAFYAYQDAFDRLELAETMEQVAAKELAEAEGQLAQALAP